MRKKYQKPKNILKHKIIIIIIFSIKPLKFLEDNSYGNEMMMFIKNSDYDDSTKYD